MKIFFCNIFRIMHIELSRCAAKEYGSSAGLLGSSNKDGGC